MRESQTEDIGEMREIENTSATVNILANNRKNFRHTKWRPELSTAEF